MRFNSWRSFSRDQEAAPPLYSGLLGAVFGYFVSKGVNPAVVASQLCALTAMVTQTLANIAWPNGGRLVIGSSTFTVVESAGGKSAVYVLLIKRILEHLSQLALALEQDRKTPASMVSIEDVTREAIIDELATARSAVLYTTEGSQATSVLLKHAGTVVKLIDAEGLKHARRTGNRRIEISADTRFTFHGLIQHGPAQDFGDSICASRSDIGMPNRLTFCWVPPDLNTDNPLHGIDPNAQAILAVLARAMVLLERSFEVAQNDKFSRPLLRMTRECCEYFLHIEQEALRSASSEALPHVRTYLKRHAERCLKDAGARHVFEWGPEGEVELSTMQAAHRLGQESIKAFCTLTHRPPKLTKPERHLAQLEDFLRKVTASLGTRLKMSDLRKHSVNSGLTPSQFNGALAALCLQRKAVVQGDFLHFFPYGSVPWNGM